MHQEAFDYIKCIQEEYRIGETPLNGLDIGGQLINMPVHHLFPKVSWTVLDIEDGVGVDIVADGTTWRSDTKYDLVLSTEVLEHLEDWRGIMTTCAEALETGGILILTCASVGRPPHSAHGVVPVPPGEWYANVPVPEIEKAAEGLFTYFEAEFNREHGDAYLIAWK